ncbi:MAG: hypothetical protein HGA98_00205, partial [Deltaproteobacteria bacterium]|nr:hypothetical protein [Deltaproteobacteria bacterium]
MPEVGGLTGAGPGQILGPGTPAETAPPARSVSAAELLGVKAGDLVAATLTEELGGGEGIVDVGGRLLRALYPEGMAQGARVTLRVVSRSGGPV